MNMKIAQRAYDNMGDMDQSHPDDVELDEDEIFDLVREYAFDFAEPLMDLLLKHKPDGFEEMLGDKKDEKIQRMLDDL